MVGKKKCHALQPGRARGKRRYVVQTEAPVQEFIPEKKKKLPNRNKPRKRGRLNWGRRVSLESKLRKRNAPILMQWKEGGGSDEKGGREERRRRRLHQENRSRGREKDVAAPNVGQEGHTGNVRLEPQQGDILLLGKGRKGGNLLPCSHHRRKEKKRHEEGVER